MSLNVSLLSLSHELPPCRMKTLLIQRKTWSCLWQEEASSQTLEPPPVPSTPLTSLAIVTSAGGEEEVLAWHAQQKKEEVQKV